MRRLRIISKWTRDTEPTYLALEYFSVIASGTFSCSSSAINISHIFLGVLFLGGGGCPMNTVLAMSILHWLGKV
jgi:hypothetical protein